MKILDVEQGSPEWIKARLGKPTASQFHRLITPATLKPSGQAAGYMHELLAELLIDGPVNDGSTGFMQRGTELEREAVAYYELQRDVDTRKVGLCLADSGLYGCSPDRLVGDDGGLEIKAPGAKAHVDYLLNGMPAEYLAQVQGALLVTGRVWWDWLAYHPLMPAVLVRVERDEKYIAALREALDAFLEQMKYAKLKLGLPGGGFEVSTPDEPTIAHRPVNLTVVASAAEPAPRAPRPPTPRDRFLAYAKHLGFNTRDKARVDSLIYELGIGPEVSGQERWQRAWDALAAKYQTTGIPAMEDVTPITVAPPRTPEEATAQARFRVIELLMNARAAAADPGRAFVATHPVGTGRLWLIDERVLDAARVPRAPGKGVELTTLNEALLQVIAEVLERELAQLVAPE